MKIIRLEAENVKRIKAISIEPEGNLVVVGGRNGAGKTSVLDSIAYALGGKSLCPSRPIRDGERSARARVDLGEFVVERTWTRKGSYLKVRNASGFEATSPQTVLDGLVGRLTFDPLEFAGMSPRDQVEALKELVGLDFADVDQKRAELYAERTDVNREIKRLEGQLAGIPEVEAPEEPVRVAELMAQLKAAQEHNAQQVALAQKIDDAERRVAHWRAEVKRLKHELTTAEETLETAEATLADRETALGAFEMADTAELEQRIAEADEVNARVRRQQERARLAAAMKSAKAKSAKHTAAIEALDTQKRDALACVAFPVEGLSFDEDQVLLDGIPFDQASSAEQLRVSVAMGLAANPELRVLLIRDGSLLDDDNLSLVAQMAEEADAQVWVERVGDGDEVSVLIEDGEVAV